MELVSLQMGPQRTLPSQEEVQTQEASCLLPRRGPHTSPDYPGTQVSDFSFQNYEKINPYHDKPLRWS